MKFITLLLSCTLNAYIIAQNTSLQFSYPLDRSLIVTGNYGEIRPNHFHAGLDFSTHPSMNLPIKSVADGYVSRIKISSGGYGRVLYITHPNGYVTVYAHQKKFIPLIDNYTKAKQIETKQNEIELFPKPNELPVKKGEVIGYTGNTGNSSGPHLHFEIREEKTEIPINPLLVYSLADHVKPLVTHIAFYNANDTDRIKLDHLEPVKIVNEKLTLSKNIIICKNNQVAFGFSGYDLGDIYFNKNTIYEAKLLMDERLIYHHQLDRIDFENARYVNVFSNKENNIKIQKCFTPICYNVPIYKTLINRGKIILLDTLVHKIDLIVIDEQGNNNIVSWNIKAKQISINKPNNKIYNAICNHDFALKTESVEVSIKAGRLSQNYSISAIRSTQKKEFIIGDETMTLIKPASIALKITNPIKGKENKMVMMNDGKCIGGKYENDWLKAESKALGLFYIAYDTIAPTITSNIITKKLQDISDVKSIQFKVADALSGISNYNIYVNDIWHIAEYDAKSETITCYFTDETATGEIIIKIEVFDNVSNIGKLEFKTTRNF